MCLVFAVQPGSVYKTMYLLLDLWHSWRLQQYRMWSRNRQGVTVSPSVSAYVCVPSPLWLPKETRAHTIFTSSSERKKENKLHHFVVVLLLLLLSVQHLHSSPECQAHEWLEDGDALTFMSPEMGCGVRWGFLSVFIPSNWCHGFSRCEESGSQLCVCVWGHRRVFKNTQTHCCCGMKGQIKACPLFIMA